MAANSSGVPDEQVLRNRLAERLGRRRDGRFRQCLRTRVPIRAGGEGERRQHDYSRSAHHCVTFGKLGFAVVPRPAQEGMCSCRSSLAPVCRTSFPTVFDKRRRRWIANPVAQVLGLEPEFACALVR